VKRWRGRAVAAFALTVTALLTACGSDKPPDPAMVAAEDHEFTTLRRLARSAFENGQYAQAVGLYDKALDRAFARDDLPAIGDLGYESALALLRDGRPEDAAKRARETATELTRRGQTPFAALILAEAVALYGAQDAAAGPTAARARDAAGGNTATVARANYLLGMIAADQRDTGALAQCLAALGDPIDPGLRADRQELLGRSQLLSGAPTQALATFRDTVIQRRDTKDLPGVARALAFAGRAAADSGNGAEAADLYLRAGRAAQANNRPKEARQWLGSAARLAESSNAAAVLTEARERLASLD
jgi:hypothetical protein